ncbi:hypothetical protein V6245_06070 [Salinibacterium amurskyense]|uniref:hypothetical protein n=1 Tax=Salinibacterium amurskyense TaxID=205941 RepID=UPI00311DF7A8
MTDASNPLPAAGWYRDPAGGAAPRWWNGTAWAAANTVPADATPLPTPAPAPVTPPAASANPVPPIAPISPVAPSASVAPAATTLGAGSAPSYSYAAPSDLSDTGTNTWQIWLLVLLPLLQIPGIVAIDTSAYVPRLTDGPADAQLRLMLDPGYLWVSLSGWLIFLAAIPLAIFDRRALDRRGVDRPFHWAFVFIGWFVYAIGRSVVVRRRTGQGLAPLWGSVGVVLLGFIANIIFFVSLVAQISESF